LGDFLDNLERQIIELIEKVINEWWENKAYFVYNDCPHLQKDFMRSLSIKMNKIDTDAKSLSQKVDRKVESNESNLKDLSSKISEFHIVRDIFQEKLETLENENKNLKKEIQSLKNEIIQQRIKPNVSPIASTPSEDNKNAVSISSNNIVKANIIRTFNTWAKEPNTNLPPQFSFADGELRLREKQNINKEGNNNSLWIINKSGTVEYLFPNPNAIDQIAGNIDTIYHVSGIRKAKGQNKVIIKEVCEIKDGNWIDYKGELSLL